MKRIKQIVRTKIEEIKDFLSNEYKKLKLAQIINLVIICMICILILIVIPIEFPNIFMKPREKITLNILDSIFLLLSTTTLIFSLYSYWIGNKKLKKIEGGLNAQK